MLKFSSEHLHENFIFIGTQDDKKNKKKDDDGENSSSNVNSQSGRILKIHRTFRNPEGQEFTRVEIVRKAAIIDTYVKIRNSKDDTFIKSFATLDDAAKEEMKREKRRLQEQLRRIKRNQERERMLSGVSQLPQPMSTERSLTLNGKLIFFYLNSITILLAITVFLISLNQVITTTVLKAVNNSLRKIYLIVLALRLRHRRTQAL